MKLHVSSAVCTRCSAVPSAALWLHCSCNAVAAPLHLLHKGFNGKFISLNGRAGRQSFIHRQCNISSRPRGAGSECDLPRRGVKRSFPFTGPVCQASLCDLINWDLGLNRRGNCWYVLKPVFLVGNLKYVDLIPSSIKINKVTCIENIQDVQQISRKVEYFQVQCSMLEWY
jgi:hypothetical protein